jgi:phosphatidylglycerol:prolipoprotein diacylglycerol transferase
MRPVLFEIGGVAVYTYGLFAALALLAALWAAGRRAGRFGLSRKDASDLVFIFFACGILGARLFYIAQHPAEYLAHPLKILSLREGGLVWYGGFFGAAAAGALYAKWKKWPLLTVCDLFAPVLPLVHGVGRIGCFLNGCCYGKEAAGFRHPVQLYEAGSLFALSGLLFLLSAKLKAREGALFAAYLFFYGLLRFTVEFWRGDQTAFAGLTPPQWTSLLLIAGSLFLFGRVPKDHARV